MSTIYLANGVNTTLALPCLSTDTQITVASYAGFPISGIFALLIESEVMYVTSAAGDVWQVTRAAEPYGGVQTAAGHPAGALVWCVLTAGIMPGYVLQELVAALDGLGGVTGFF
jgi:hypothetical protein